MSVFHPETLDSALWPPYQNQREPRKRPCAITGCNRTCTAPWHICFPHTQQLPLPIRNGVQRASIDCDVISLDLEDRHEKSKRMQAAIDAAKEYLSG